MEMWKIPMIGSSRGEYIFKERIQLGNTNLDRINLPCWLGELMNVWKTFFIFWVKLSHSRQKKENTLLHVAILREGIGVPQFIYQALKSLGNGLCTLKTLQECETALTSWTV